MNESLFCTSAASVFQQGGCCGSITPYDNQCAGSFVVGSVRATARALMLQNLDVDTDVGRHYDPTRVTLNGITFCPFAFGATLAHPEPLRAPRCDDVEELYAYVRCPTTFRFPGLYAVADAVRPLVGRAPTAAPPGFALAASARQAYEMAEVYAMAWMRDCALDRYAAEAECASRCAVAVAALNDFADRPFDADCGTLFTLTPGKFAHARSVPSVSQLQHKGYWSDATLYVGDRRFRVEADQTQLWTRSGDLAYETGGTPPNTQLMEERPAYATTGRALGTKVHSEPVDSHYKIAVAQLQTLRPRSGHSALDGGYDDVLLAVSEVARLALQESYRAKYTLGMKIRPAAYARLVDAALRGVEAAPLGALHSHLLGPAPRKALLDAVAGVTNATTGEYNYLLPVQYETSRHPSWTHGHATVAGACATVLKALFEVVDTDGTLAAWPEVVRTPTADGAELEDVVGATTTYAAEIDKLAIDAARGRNFAGQHFRTELEESLYFGERIALNYLRGRSSTEARTVPLFDGTCVRLTDGASVSVPCAPPSPPPSPPPVVAPLDAIQVSVANFLRLTPQPTLSMTPHAPVEIDEIRFVQRQMAYGDSTTRRARVRLNGGAVQEQVDFGLPATDGTTGTLLTTFTPDSFGRVGEPSAVSVALGARVNMTDFAYTVERVYAYTPPSPPPQQYGGYATQEGARRALKGNVVIAFPPTSPPLLSPAPPPSPAAPPLLAASVSTDSFYRDGTWDVGLVEVRFYLQGTLVSEYAVASAQDNSGYRAPAPDDLAVNPFRNPYRTYACQGPITAIPSLDAACVEEDRGYVARDADGAALWPCPFGADTLGCSFDAIPKAWTFPGWAVRDYAYWGNATFDPSYQIGVLPLASPENFARLTPKPALTFTWATPLSGVRRIGVRQRQMAYYDATMSGAEVCYTKASTGADRTCVAVPFDSTTTLYTEPDNGDPIDFGRAGKAGERVVDFGAAVQDLTSITLTVTSVNAYAPPAEWTAGADPEKARWGVTRMEETFAGFYGYVHPTMGTWNVGFTHAALYDAAGGQLPAEEVLAVTATSNGAFAGADFHPSNPLQNGYAAEPPPAVWSSWCWFGYRVLHGLESGYGFVENTLPPAPPSEPEPVGEPIS